MRSFLGAAALALTAAALALVAVTSAPIRAQGAAAAPHPPDQILLKDYRPVAIHKVPVTRVEKARFPAIDMHSHAYAKTPEDVDRWVKVMDAVGVEKTVVLTGAHGAEFDKVAALYSRYPTRFELWCGFDYTGFDKPGYGPAAVAELERCAKQGGKGIGEEGDKGKGAGFGKVPGMHFDDPRMDPLFEACARLGLPVNVHVADPIWMYQKMDATNDGLMNAVEWRLDDKPGIVGHSGMVDILERTVRRHPRTTFVACHLANLDYDLERLGRLLDALPNLYADFAARYAETAVVPRVDRALLPQVPGPARLRHRHGLRRGHVPDDVPHPRERGRPLLRTHVQLPLELRRLRAGGARAREALPRERARRHAARGRERGPGVTVTAGRA